MNKLKKQTKTYKYTSIGAYVSFTHINLIQKSFCRILPLTMKIYFYKFSQSRSKLAPDYLVGLLNRLTNLHMQFFFILFIHILFGNRLISFLILVFVLLSWSLSFSFVRFSICIYFTCSIPFFLIFRIHILNFHNDLVHCVCTGCIFCCVVIERERERAAHVGRLCHFF